MLQPPKKLDKKTIDLVSLFRKTAMMNQATKSRSAEEKAVIVQEGREQGMAQTCRKYSISQKTYYQWRDKFEQGGMEALRPQKTVIDPELVALRKENERLKRLVAEKELIISVKDELIKKTSPRSTNGGRLSL
jgi:putative transposase